MLFRSPTIDRAQIEDPGYVKDGVPTPAIVDILSDGTRKFIRRMTPEEIKKATHIPGTETPTEARTRQESLDTAEAWFNAPRPEQEAAQLNTAFGALRAAHKDWSPQRIMRSLMQAAQTGGRIEATSAATQQREQKAAEDALFSNIMQQSGMNIPPASPMVRPDTSRSRAGVAGTVQNPRPDATTTSAPLSALPPSVDKIGRAHV